MLDDANRATTPDRVEAGTEFRVELRAALLKALGEGHGAVSTRCEHELVRVGRCLTHGGPRPATPGPEN